MIRRFSRTAIVLGSAGLLAACGPALIIVAAASAGGGGGGGSSPTAAAQNPPVSSVFANIRTTDTSGAEKNAEFKTTSLPKDGAGPTPVLPRTMLGIPGGLSSLVVEGDKPFTRVVIYMDGFSGFMRLDLAEHPSSVPLNLTVALASSVKQNPLPMKMALMGPGGTFGTTREFSATLSNAPRTEDPSNTAPFCSDTQGVVLAAIVWGILGEDPEAPLLKGGDLDLTLTVPGFGDLFSFDSLCGAVPPEIEDILGGQPDLPFEVILIDPVNDPNFPTIPLGTYRVDVTMFGDDITCTEFPFKPGIDELFYLVSICHDGQDALTISGTLDLLDDASGLEVGIETDLFSFDIGDSLLWVSDPAPVGWK